MKHMSISTKILCALLALCLLFILGLWVFQFAFFERSYISNKVDELEGRAYELAGYIDSNLYTAAFYAALWGSNNNILILITDETGYEVPLFSRRTWDAYLLQNTFLKVSEVWQDGKLRDYYTDKRIDALGNTFDVVYARVGIRMDNGYLLFLARPISGDVREAVSLQQRQFLILSGIFIGVSVILSMFLARQLTKPIRNIEKRAREMADGDLQTPFVPTTKDEIGELALTMENLRVSLQQVDVLSKELIANVSHELRTPLTIIRGYADTVRELTWRDDIKRETQLLAIGEESERLEKLVSDILNYSQLQAGKVQFQESVTDFSRVTVRTAERMKEYFHAGGLELTIDVEPDMSIEGDEQKLEQLIVNMLANAYNHTPQGGHVRIALKSHKDTVSLEVEDDGEGIAADELANIWDRYYKATLRPREDRIGTGLGLAICKSILDAHGARYMVASEEGEGTRFAMEFDHA